MLITGHPLLLPTQAPLMPTQFVVDRTTMLLQTLARLETEGPVPFRHWAKGPCEYESQGPFCDRYR